jgi:hypothetical protein
MFLGTYTENEHLHRCSSFPPGEENRLLSQMSWTSPPKESPILPLLSLATVFARPLGRTTIPAWTGGIASARSSAVKQSAVFTSDPSQEGLKASCQLFGCPLHAMCQQAVHNKISTLVRSVVRQRKLFRRNESCSTRGSVSHQCAAGESSHSGRRTEGDQSPDQCALRGGLREADVPRSVRHVARDLAL